MEVLPTSYWDEGYGPSIFISYSRDSDGAILGESPELSILSAYTEVDFDEKKWTHFISGVDLNFLFSDVDPINFPPMIKDSN